MHSLIFKMKQTKVEQVPDRSQSALPHIKLTLSTPCKTHEIRELISHAHEPPVCVHVIADELEHGVL